MSKLDWPDFVPLIRYKPSSTTLLIIQEASPLDILHRHFNQKRDWAFSSEPSLTRRLTLPLLPTSSRCNTTTTYYLLLQLTLPASSTTTSSISNTTADFTYPPLPINQTLPAVRWPPGQILTNMTSEVPKRNQFLCPQ